MFDMFIHILGWITFVTLILGAAAVGLLYLWAKAMGMPK